MKKTTATLTVQEKIRLLTGKDFWHTDDLDGKIPNITMSDGPVGLRTERTGEDGKTFTIPAVAYPSIQALANTWNPECARVMGECLADDCRDRGVELLLAPGVNIKRHPLNGRNFEYFSEDPQLAGVLAKAYVEGAQDSGIGVCLKHFCCNNLEYDRLHQTSDVDERTLRELYYRPFEIVCEAKPVSVMCSYNRINGEYAAEYRKGFDFLRDECGFDGAVVSDWGAVRDRTASVKAGLDLEMPHGEAGMEKLARDLQEGSVTEGELDVCVGRVLQLVQRLKEMGKGKENKRTEAERAAAARGIAEESIVLLKNNGVLPLEKGALLSVSGIYAKPDQTDYLAGGGSAAVRWPENTFDLPAALTARGFSCAYEPAFGVSVVHSFRQNARTAVLNAAKSDVNIVCVGTGGRVEFEEGDRLTMRLPEVQERVILDSAACNPNTVVIVFAGAAVDMSAWEDSVEAILYAGFPGMGGAEALADILTGKVNPSGKLSETFPLAVEDVPAAGTYRRAGVTRYQEGLDVGYRYFDTYDVPVLYPFGHGLKLFRIFLPRSAPLARRRPCRRGICRGERLRLRRQGSFTGLCRGRRPARLSPEEGTQGLLQRSDQGGKIRKSARGTGFPCICALECGAGYLDGDGRRVYGQRRRVGRRYPSYGETARRGRKVRSLTGTARSRRDEGVTHVRVCF